LSTRSGVRSAEPVFVGSSEFFACRIEVSFNVSVELGIQSFSTGDAEGFVESRKVFLTSEAHSDIIMCDVLVSCVGLEFLKGSWDV